MDSSRKYLTLKCEVCGSEYVQQERVFKKSKWKNRCKSHRKEVKETNKCVDCGKECYGNRCITCSNKNRITLNHNNKCIDCGVKIKPKSKRCLKCHNINQDKGKSIERTKFNNSKEWKKIRIDTFERDNYTCKICNKRGGNLNAHHIKPYKNNLHHRLDINNLVTLCVQCHLKLHHNDNFKNKYKKYINEKD